jgi:cyclic pyranopterin phosphate synthase
MTTARAAPLYDGQGRTVEYVRLSVTDRCDLRCTYCLPRGFRGFIEPAHWLDFDEIVRVVGLLARLGVRRVRLTGGEPLLRRNVPQLAARLAAVPGIDDLSLSTNGTLLAGAAAALRRSRVARLNVSLDSLDRARFARITGRDVLPQVLRGLDAAADAGFAPIKINMVAMGDTETDEIDDMVAFCVRRGFVLRLIETMPMGITGRGAGFVDLAPVRARLRERFDLIDGVVVGGGPARYLVSRDGRLSIGFITPVSRHFCATCNRVRVTVDGQLHLCLGQDDRVDLRALMRAGADDAALAQAVLHGLRRKPARHEFIEHRGRTIRVMAQTGG